MTKTRLLLVGLLLVVGLGVLAPSAMAVTNQPSYLSVTQVAYWVRANGGAEATGPITVTFTSGYGIIDGGETFTITLTQPIVGASGINSALYADFCTDTTGTYCKVQTISASGNSIVFKNGPAPITGMMGQSITFYGLRINAIGLVVGSYITATIGAALDHIDPLYFGPPPGNPISVAGLQVAYIAGDAISVSGPVDCASGLPLSAGSMLTCKAFEAYQHKHNRDDSGKPSFAILVVENWSGAWTALSDELVYGPYAPNVGNTVTNGSDISITVSGIPQGVTVTPLAPSIPSGCTTCNETWGPTPTAYTGTVWNDSHLFDFPLSTTNHNEIESAIFSFNITTSGLITPDDPPMSVSITLDPHTTSQTTAPSPGLYPWFYYAQGSEEEAYPIIVFFFTDCETSLLFPYVTNFVSGAGGGPMGNWDTFINIANATSDPWYPGNPWNLKAKGYAIPQDGSCTFYVYHAGTVASEPGSGPMEAVPIVFTGPIQLSGGEFGTDLSATPAAGVPGAYVIVICEFLNATGYAQIVDNFGVGNWQIMSSYLAYVIPNHYKYNRALAGNNLGEFAIVQTDEDWLEDTMWKIFRISKF